MEMIGEADDATFSPLIVHVRYFLRHGRCCNRKHAGSDDRAANVSFDCHLNSPVDDRYTKAHGGYLADSQARSIGLSTPGIKNLAERGKRGTDEHFPMPAAATHAGRR